MSVQNALAFMRLLRNDDAARQKLAEHAPSSLAELRLLSQTGDFSDDDLILAFRMDWAARWAHFSRTKGD